MFNKQTNKNRKELSEMRYQNKRKKEKAETETIKYQETEKKKVKRKNYLQIKQYW